MIPRIKILLAPQLLMRWSSPALARKLLSCTVSWVCICGTAIAQVNVPGALPDRTSAVNAALNAFDPPAAPQVSSPPSLFLGHAYKISGDARFAFGVDANGNAIFSRANADLDERNYRQISNSALNNNINTYDPQIYSRFKTVLDASIVASVVSIHLNVSVDPWSYTGKSNTVLVTNSTWGDAAKVQYLFWGNTGYTVNTLVNTLRIGDAFALPELKVKGNVVPPLVISGSFQNIYGQSDVLTIPSAKIDYSFQPFREAWVDIKTTDNGNIRLFPMGYENQALTTDDPLKLSNNKIWWEESPWIDGWQGGNFNGSAQPPNFSKGQWDRSLAFYTKDSEGQRLTALRGVSLDQNLTDETSLKATIASPKTLWQDYNDFEALPASARLKQFIGDLFYIGALADMHQGFVDGNRDAENYTGGVDTGFIPLKGVKVSAEYASSRSRYDITSPAYATKDNGNAYFASLETSSNAEDMINKDYFGFQPIDKTDTFYKSRLYFTRMDDGFESSLSNYHETRDDSYWSDHLTFYPSDYRYMPGGEPPSQSEYDLEPFAIGNGIDYGRTVVGWRGDTDLMEGKFQGLADIRHVTDNNGDNIETVSRMQGTYEATDKLTTKALLLWHDLPKTITGIDPFATDGNTGQNLINTYTVGGKDPSIKTGSLGARYELTDWAAVNGVWECTNDFYLSTNDLPESILNPLPGFTDFLYDQYYFEQAPYSYYNILKTGLELIPDDKWHIYLDYTRNPNKFAQNIDDNMSHYGIETSYVPNPKIGFFVHYAYSQGYDINRLVNDQNLDYRGYNNFSFETRMILPKDVTLSIEYGVGPAYNVQNSSTNPNLTFYTTSVVQTQHIVRVVFDKKF